MSQKLLIVDSIDSHDGEDGVMVVHPAHLSAVENFAKASFDRCLIAHSPAQYLRAIALFNIAKCLKSGAICEIIIYQPLSVLQDLDAGQIEAYARLAGFKDIREESYNGVENIRGRERKVSTLKLSMTRP
jgi:hypothetical protein